MMMYLICFGVSFIMLMSTWSFCSNRKHLLSVLLSLEFMILSIFVFLVFFLNFFNCELFFSMMFLVFSVCEGALGLSILVSMVRTHGNDYFQMFNILQC